MSSTDTVSRRRFLSGMAAAGVAAYQGAVLGFGQEPAAPRNVRVGGANLLQLGDIAYVGSFRFPASWGYGHEGLAYNPVNHSLFAGSASGQIGEALIPTPSASPVFSALPVASIVPGQASRDPSEGRFAAMGGSVDKLGGLLVHNGELFFNYHLGYGGNIAQSHLVRPLSLSKSGSVRGWYQVKAGQMWNGWTAGAMCSVPPEWQTSLGCKALTGQNTLSLMSGDPGGGGGVVGRSGWGPTAFGFNPEDCVGPNGTDVYASPLVAYTMGHYFLGESGDMPGVLYRHWNQASRIRGIVFPGGSSRSVLFFGTMGAGTYYYDVITNNPSLDGLPCDLPGEEGRHWRYDPALYQSNPNEHANLSWPYRMKVWAYDANDLAAVKAGTLQHHAVSPYGEWLLDFPVWLPQTATPPALDRQTTLERIYGAAHDPGGRRIYIMVHSPFADGERCVMVYAIP